LSILVNPDLGPVDEADLIKTVLVELGKGKDTRRMMAEVWLKAGTMRVKRLRPVTTARGKLMPLHLHQTR
jgi:hypothetical protein